MSNSGSESTDLHCNARQSPTQPQEGPPSPGRAPPTRTVLTLWGLIIPVNT